MRVMVKNQSNESYLCLEQGPIRPPAEARSLLIRVARNCPWNRCTFCPLYKKQRFSIRPLAHIVKDIDTVSAFIDIIRQHAGSDSAEQVLHQYVQQLPSDQVPAFNSAYQWFVNGMQTVFLQDANALILKSDDLIAILNHLRQRFPTVSRITAFARSRTILRKKTATLKSMVAAGLNRVHVGLESGSDKILKMVNKGCTKAMHIEAGHKIMDAGIELSECVLAGLGGEGFYQEHALETADAVNRIDPHIVRFLTLAVPDDIVLFHGRPASEFIKSGDLMVAREIKLFLQNLEGIKTFIESDNMLNLFQEVKGRMPGDRDRMLQALDTFIGWDAQRRMLFQVGRRLQLISGMDDLQDSQRVEQIRQVCRQSGITPDNVDRVISQMIQRFFN